MLIQKNPSCEINILSNSILPNKPNLFITLQRVAIFAADFFRMKFRIKYLLR